MTPEELAAAALERLPSPRQWLKHAQADGYGTRRCTWGAMWEVVDYENTGDNNKKIQAAAKKIADIIREQFPDRIHVNDAPECPKDYLCTCGTHGSVIVNFNDHPKTRFTDVRMILEKAAAG